MFRLRYVSAVLALLAVSACSTAETQAFDKEQLDDNAVYVSDSGSFSSAMRLFYIKSLSGLLNTFVDMEEVSIEKIREVRSRVEEGQDRDERVMLDALEMGGVPVVSYVFDGGDSENGSSVDEGSDDVSVGKVILSLHGGAYTSGSPVSAYWLNVNLMEALNLPLLSPDYRLAPEHPYPAAVDDAEAVYKALLERYAPEDIVIVGESAGGGLAFALMLRAKAQGLPMPGGIIAFSPWVDVSLQSESIQRNRDRDFLNPDEIKRWAKAYAAETDPTVSEISPVFGDLSGLPPTLILAGTEEIILDDSIRMHKALQAHGVTSALQIWEGMWHIWPNMEPDSFPEIPATMAACHAFYQSHIAAMPTEASLAAE